MPINLVAKSAGNAGVVSPTLGDAAVNFDGTFVTPGSFTGSISADLGQSDADFVGLFTQLPNRTGTIATTLSGATSAFTNSAVQNNVARITSILNGRTVPFSYNTPIDPSTTPANDVTVTTMSALQSAVQQANTQITISAAFGTQSGNVTISAADVDVICSNSATIDGTISFSNNRQRWTGGNQTGGHLTCGSVSDIMVDNLNSLNEDNQTNNFSNFNNRVAVINTTLSAIGTAGGNGWLFYCDQQSANTGLIFGNVKFAAPAGRQSHRINQVTNYIAIDTYFNVGDVASNSHRSHADTNTILMDGCIIGNGWLASADANGGAVQWNYGMGNGTLRNMDIYSGLSAFIVSANISNVTISDSVLHSGAGAGTPGYGGLTNGGGNSRVAWNELASGMPSGTGYGADH